MTMPKNTALPKEPTLQVTPKSSSKKDKETAKMMAEFLNYEYDKHKSLIEAIILAKHFLSLVYAASLPEHLWDNILQAHVNELTQAHQDTAQVELERIKTAFHEWCSYSQYVTGSWLGHGENPRDKESAWEQFSKLLDQLALSEQKKQK